MVGEQLVIAAGVAVDDPRAELVAGRVGDHPGVGLVADPQAVLGEQPGGVRVVGRHRRLEHVVVAAPRAGVDRRIGQQTGGQQRLADPGAELAAALVVNVSPRTWSGRTWPVATR